MNQIEYEEMWREVERKAEISLERSLQPMVYVVIIFFACMALYGLYEHFYGN